MTHKQQGWDWNLILLSPHGKWNKGFPGKKHEEGHGHVKVFGIFGNNKWYSAPEKHLSVGL